MESKLQIDRAFELRLREMRDAAADQAARLTGGRATWYRPAGTTDLTDLVNVGAPFDRAEFDALATAVLADAASPGTTGDLVLAALTLTTLSQLERAARTRATVGRIRAAGHALGRHASHGRPTGAFGAVLEAARRTAVLAREKESQ